MSKMSRMISRLNRDLKGGEAGMECDVEEWSNVYAELMDA